MENKKNTLPKLSDAIQKEMAAKHTTVYSQLHGTGFDAYVETLANITHALGNQHVDPKSMCDVTDIYCVPFTKDQLIFLERVLSPLLSVSFGQGEEMDETWGPDVMYKVINRVRKAVGNAVPYLSIYYVHQAYGGPEEGGWYYDQADFSGAYVLDDSDAAALREVFAEVLNDIDNPLITVDDLMSGYDAFVNGRQVTREEPAFEGPVLRHKHYADMPLDAIVNIAWRNESPNGYSSRCELVFEWAPGLHATTERPIYC